MKHVTGQIVAHKKFGIGKVLAVSGDTVTVFFKSEAENPRTINVSVVPMTVPAQQADAWLDQLDLDAAAKGRVRQSTFMTHGQAVEKFLSFFPKGFYDPKYLGDTRTGERHYKFVAHELWHKKLNVANFGTLIEREQWPEIAARAMEVEGKTNLLATFEKIALREAIQKSEDARIFSIALFDLIYGSDPFEQRFGRFSQSIDQLPQPKTPLRWTVQTIFPFLALPKEHLFLKPGVTQEAAERRAFDLNYSPQPNWLTYSRLLKFAEALKQDLSDLEPRDMIDIQSFIYVTGNYE